MVSNDFHTKQNACEITRSRDNVCYLFFQKSDEDKETREAALKQYKKKKKKNYRNMSKVNYKGQPNMASRMDMLLEKIKKPNS